MYKNYFPNAPMGRIYGNTILIEMIPSNLQIKDISSTIPQNPHYSTIPLRESQITHIVWHDCGTKLPFSVDDLIDYSLSSNHINKKGCPIPLYSYYITSELCIYKLVDDKYRTWHSGVPDRYKDNCPAWNEISLSIAFEFFGLGRKRMSDSMLQIGIDLTREISRSYCIPPSNVLGHRELSGSGHVPSFPQRLRTPCPGMGVDMNLVRLFLTR